MTGRDEPMGGAPFLSMGFGWIVIRLPVWLPIPAASGACPDAFCCADAAETHIPATEVDNASQLGALTLVLLVVPFSITVSSVRSRQCCPTKCCIATLEQALRKVLIQEQDVAPTCMRSLLTGAGAAPAAPHMPVVPRQPHANALEPDMRPTSANELPSAIAGALPTGKTYCWAVYAAAL